MKLEEDIELLESLFVELDPLEDGFAGVLVEIHRCRDRYVLTVPLCAPPEPGSGHGAQPSRRRFP